MCQRVLIAMALACRPALLIADEPTTGLDVVTQATIMDLIRELAVQHRMATLFITHDLGLAARYCEHIVVMHAGHVVETAPTKEIFGTPRHPYTAKLIAATPRATMHLTDLAAIPGNLPDLRAPCPPAGTVPGASATPHCVIRRPCRIWKPPQTSGGMLEAAVTPLLEVSGLHKHFPIGGPGALGRFSPSGVPARPETSPAGASCRWRLLDHCLANASAWSVNPAVANPRSSG